MFIRHLLTAAVVTGGVLVGQAQAQTLRFGHANTTAEIAGELFQEFSDRVNKATEGAVTIRVFPAEQLGKEVDLIKQVKEGALDISAPSMAAASALVPALEMASAPFLWRDWNEAEAIIRSTAFDPVFDELRDKHSIVPLSRIWYWGWRNMTTLDREVRKPEDLQGLKIRVPESPIWVEMIKAFSASPTPVPFGEVYTALQQRTVDGQENPIPTIYARKFYEVQGVVAMTRHMLQNNMIVINRDSLSRIKPEHREIVFAEAARASAMNTYLQQKREASMLEEIRKSGRSKIIEDIDRNAFAERARAATQAMEGRWGKPNLDRLLAAIETTRKR
jgi:tripartite ATP-independent transporter DctP family solute receptor